MPRRSSRSNGWESNSWGSRDTRDSRSFHTLDNEDSGITKEQLKEWYKRHNVMERTGQKFEELWDYLLTWDIDGTGTISRQEFDRGIEMFGKKKTFDWKGSVMIAVGVCAVLMDFVGKVLPIFGMLKEGTIYFIYWAVQGWLMFVTGILFAIAYTSSRGTQRRIDRLLWQMITDEGFFESARGFGLKNDEDWSEKEDASRSSQGSWT